MTIRLLSTAIALGAALSLSAVAGSALADTTVASASSGYSPKSASIAQCVEAIQQHHDTDARLFLNNKANYREVEGARILSVQGWVWRNGERVGVTHQCTTQAKTQLALNVVYAEETQIARR